MKLKNFAEPLSLTWGFWEEPKTVMRAGTTAGFLNASRSWEVALNNASKPLLYYINKWYINWPELGGIYVLPAVSLCCQEQVVFQEFLPTPPYSSLHCVDRQISPRYNKTKSRAKAVLRADSARVDVSKRKSWMKKNWAQSEKKILLLIKVP